MLGVVRVSNIQIKTEYEHKLLFHITDDFHKLADVGEMASFLVCSCGWNSTFSTSVRMRARCECFV